jgi:hypothetical protein
MAEDHIQELLADVDRDGNGRIEYEEVRSPAHWERLAHFRCPAPMCLLCARAQPRCALRPGARPAPLPATAARHRPLRQFCRMLLPDIVNGAEAANGGGRRSSQQAGRDGGGSGDTPRQHVMHVARSGGWAASGAAHKAVVPPAAAIEEEE